MNKILITPKAREDIKNIWQHTSKNWGEKQANTYINYLKQQFKELLLFPEKGKKRDNVRQKYRSIQKQSHIIFYRQKNENIEIIRVLHKSMDIESHFN